MSDHNAWPSPHENKIVWKHSGRLRPTTNAPHEPEPYARVGDENRCATCADIIIETTWLGGPCAICSKPLTLADDIVWHGPIPAHFSCAANQRGYLLNVKGKAKVAHLPDEEGLATCGRVYGNESEMKRSLVLPPEYHVCKMCQPSPMRVVGTQEWKREIDRFVKAMGGEAAALQGVLSAGLLVRMMVHDTVVIELRPDDGDPSKDKFDYAVEDTKKVRQNYGERMCVCGHNANAHKGGAKQCIMCSCAGFALDVVLDIKCGRCRKNVITGPDNFCDPCRATETGDAYDKYAKGSR